MKMKQGKSGGRPRPKNFMKAKEPTYLKKSPGLNKHTLKEKKANKSPLKFINDIKKTKDVKPLAEKLLSQGEVVKSPGKFLEEKKNKKIRRKEKQANNKSKKGFAPPVNPDVDTAVTEDSYEEMKDNSESPANKPKKNNKKKKLNLLGKKQENGDGNTEKDDKNSENDASNTEKGKPKHPKKFCLFVGNLPYEVTKEEVGEHFKSLKDGLIAVRIMTDKKTGKGKGFGFIELRNDGAYKAALKLHKSKMGDRVIHVEYTTPGKNDSKGRKKFMNNKTKKLLGQKKHKKGKGFNKKKGKGKK